MPAKVRLEPALPMNAPVPLRVYAPDTVRLCPFNPSVPANKLSAPASKVVPMFRLVPPPVLLIVRLKRFKLVTRFSVVAPPMAPVPINASAEFALPMKLPAVRV